MPGFDGTGPMGLGPRTGGGFGYCGQGSGFAGGVLRGVGRGGFPWGGGRGRAWGGGRGMGRRWFGFGRFGFPFGAFPAWTPQDETAYLSNQALALENELSAIRERLAALEKESDRKTV
ncbi:MAG: DUF5320 domain-containing protein [bacterium]